MLNFFQKLKELTSIPFNNEPQESGFDFAEKMKPLAQTLQRIKSDQSVTSQFFRPSTTLYARKQFQQLPGVRNEPFIVKAFKKANEMRNELQGLLSHDINIDNRLKVSPFEAKRVGATIYGEMSNIGGEEEARQILSTIVNRAEQKGVSLQQVIMEPNQYKAFRGNKQYFNYMNGNIDKLSQEKYAIVQKLIKELEKQSFQPITDKTGFKHPEELQGRIRLDYDFGAR